MVPAGQNQPQQHPVVGVAVNTGQMAYGSPPYATPSPPPSALTSSIPSQPLPSFASIQHHFAYQQQAQQQQSQHLYQSQQQQLQQRELQVFWANQMQEVEQTTDFKNHSLPLARIKKIMKADEDVRMISTEAPIIFSKACEMFIYELTMRSWIHAEENKRRTLQKSDIGVSILRTNVFDFLIDIIPKEEEEVGRVNNPPTENNHYPSMADSIPYYYHHQQQQQQMGGSSSSSTTTGGGMMMGQPVDMSAMYMIGQQPNNNNPLLWPPPLHGLAADSATRIT